MLERQPSLTARGAAGHRAAHQVLERGAVFRDPYARRILGAEECARADRRAADPASKAMRFFLCARSRFAEDALARSVARGMGQAVVLGAGFDTFALRNPHPQLRVFEVDHPATQAWKRARLRQAGIAALHSLVFVPVDFEREDLASRLKASGFDSAAPAFFLWLGVVPYLTRQAILAVLRFVGECGEPEVVFDYGVPLDSYPSGARARVQAFLARVAKLGEPLLSHFEPDELHAILREAGLGEIEDLDFAAMARRYLPGLSAPIPRGGGHVLHARATPRR